MRVFLAILLVLHTTFGCGSGEQLNTLSTEGSSAGQVTRSQEPIAPSIEEESPALERSRYPYIVSVRSQDVGVHICTGVLIHPEYVLTPAHCVDPESIFAAGDSPLVHVGARNVDDTSGIEILHSEPIIHSEWKKDREELSPFNVALLKLERPSAAAVPRMLKDSSVLRDGMVRTSLGYAGSTIKLGDNIFNDLKKEYVEVIRGPSCNKIEAWKDKIGSNLFCTINTNKAASCVIDSGSPLLLLDVTGAPSHDDLIGINVHGAACGKLGAPDVFLDLRLHRKWLTNIFESGTDTSSESTCAQVAVGKFKIDVSWDWAARLGRLDVFAGDNRVAHIDDVIALMTSIITPSGAWLIIAAFFKNMRSVTAKMVILWVIATAASTTFGLMKCTK